ncbi:hypothetical protein P8452_47417 [Trifolium repens]|nr:hypothetical protein P8452_47417 [Trifolium repens]
MGSRICLKKGYVQEPKQPTRAARMEWCCEESWIGVACSGFSAIHLKIQGMSLTGSHGAALYNLQNLKIFQEIPLKPYLLTKPSVSTLQLSPHCLHYVN